MNRRCCLIAGLIWQGKKQIPRLAEQSRLASEMASSYSTTENVPEDVEF